MLGEEDFKRVQLLWNTFDIIKSVDSNNELDALEFTF
jgi:hypothetical protein